jgi:hypothetical protein
MGRKLEEVSFVFVDLMCLIITRYFYLVVDSRIWFGFARVMTPATRWYPVKTGFF